MIHLIYTRQKERTKCSEEHCEFTGRAPLFLHFFMQAYVRKAFHDWLEIDSKCKAVNFYP